MKVLKVIGIALLVVIGAYFVSAAFISEDFIIEKSIEVQLPKEKTYELAADFNFYREWNPWSKMEQDEVSNITGTGKDIGDVWSWKGDTIGEGSLTHQEFVPNERIVNQMHFVTPMESEAKDVWLFEPTETGTLITWKYEGKSEFLMRPMAELFMRGMLEQQFEDGLATFKELAEAAPAEAPTMAISQSEMPQFNYIGIETTCSMDTMDKVMGRLYGELMAYVGKNGIEMTGAPISITTSWSPELSTFWAALQVPAGTKGNGKNIKAGEITPRACVTGTHVGSYSKLYDAHMAIDSYFKENNLGMDYPVVEVYVNDPGQTAEEDLQTEIYYPVAAAE